MTNRLSSTITLEAQGQRLLQFLVSKLSSIKPNDPRTFTSYKQVHDELNLSQEGDTFGTSLQHQGLNTLAQWTLEQGLPGITGLIIHKEKLSPGPGYYKLFGRNQDDFQWWLGEIQKSINFDWAPYLPTSQPSEKHTAGRDWTTEELRAAVVAYLEMQRLNRASTPFIKTKYYQALATQFGRTAKSFEFRMQNISYVLTLMGRDWLSGLKPAKNVGANIAEQIEQLIAEVEHKPVVPVVTFELEVRESIKKPYLPQPKGSLTPKSCVTSVTQYQRDPEVKAWVLKEADGVCECCKQPAPFKNVEGMPFLEVHHVRKLAENGSDTINNAVATCPNCHRALHYGVNAKDLVEGLYSSVKRLIRE